ncbi:hypothetical protein M501DRAFT_925618 [Patellaria atrata CBS 101060]|uniref:BTB domain-containing protein n=1 Tax=Patellaria atrata CBS 101060 TaxID=1346257 RepID=A0A9P4SIH1_9PEZI|nr:hypothetical protein M501DRAFT_925618 [Patellaria atrata CBS 101060]
MQERNRQSDGPSFYQSRSEFDGPIVISRAGDLILDVRDDISGESFSYRVEAELLRRASPYFANLFGGRFSEAASIFATHVKLGNLYPKVADASWQELPRVSISDIGRISKVNTIRNLTADFLRILHDLDLDVVPPPIPNLANLAIVADRFDAISYFSRYVSRRKFLQVIDAKSKGKALSVLTEERVRQRLLLGIMLDHAPWVVVFSKRLIITGSSKWKAEVSGDNSAALWWDLPNNVEEELISRREYVLETINSLQTHFLKLYSSGERQCKLGYDSSVQCDSFQLGEMIRFFLRLGTLRLQGTIFDLEQPSIYLGDIDRLIETLRQCANYQIDRNHTHCGLRTRLIPLLDMVQNHLSLDAGSLDLGICADCWRNNQEIYTWREAKRPLMWSRSSLTRPRFPLKPVCLGRHIMIRDMFTAVERDWTANQSF